MKHPILRNPWIIAVAGGTVAAVLTHMAFSLRDDEPVSQPSGEAAQYQLSPVPTSSSDMEETLEPLSPDILKRRIEEVFPAGYLTIIAIIQGVALGAAIVTTQQQLINQRGTVNRLTVVAQALAVFAAIVVITHRYLILTINNRWAPAILDTLVPYGLGVGEIAASIVIGPGAAWWIAVSIVFLAAAGTYVHTYLRASNASLQVGDPKTIRTRVLYCCTLLGYTATIAGLAANNIIPGWLGVILPCGTIIGAIAIAISGERDQNRIYDASGIPRWRLGLWSRGLGLAVVMGGPGGW